MFRITYKFYKISLVSQAEETKVLRLQLELSQAKGDLERRLQEKEEETEAARYLISSSTHLLISSSRSH